MKTKTKYQSCLNNSFKAFNQGDPDLAIRSLNITFNHATNTDWSATDVQHILSFLSWLYFYESRFDKVASVLERAIADCKKSPSPRGQKSLPYLLYNLAECYHRLEQPELSNSKFQIALHMLKIELGGEHKTYKLLESRYLQIQAERDKSESPLAHDDCVMNPAELISIARTEDYVQLAESWA